MPMPLNRRHCKCLHFIIAYFAYWIISSSLREINFGDCLLRTSGALHFSNALKNNHLKLEVLDLSFNEIELEGGLPLVAAMCNKPNLKHLNLNGNNVMLPDVL